VRTIVEVQTIVEVRNVQPVRSDSVNAARTMKCIIRAREYSVVIDAVNKNDGTRRSLNVRFTTNFFRSDVFIGNFRTRAKFSNRDET
jgi:hypothetical protein